MSPFCENHFVLEIKEICAPTSKSSLKKRLTLWGLIFLLFNFLLPSLDNNRKKFVWFIFNISSILSIVYDYISKFEFESKKTPFKGNIASVRLIPSCSHCHCMPPLSFIVDMPISNVRGEWLQLLKNVLYRYKKFIFKNRENRDKSLMRECTSSMYWRILLHKIFLYRLGCSPSGKALWLWV